MAAKLAVCPCRGGRSGTCRTLRYFPWAAAHLAVFHSSPGHRLLSGGVFDSDGLEHLCGKRPLPAVSAARGRIGRYDVVPDSQPHVSGPLAENSGRFSPLSASGGVTVRENIRKSQIFLQKYLFNSKKMVYNIHWKYALCAKHKNRRETV